MYIFTKNLTPLIFSIECRKISILIVYPSITFEYLFKIEFRVETIIF